MAGYFVETDKGYVGQVALDGHYQGDLRAEFAYCFATAREATEAGLEVADQVRWWKVQED